MEISRLLKQWNEKYLYDLDFLQTTNSKKTPNNSSQFSPVGKKAYIINFFLYCSAPGFGDKGILSLSRVLVILLLLIYCPLLLDDVSACCPMVNYARLALTGEQHFPLTIQKVVMREEGNQKKKKKITFGVGV